MGIIEAVKSNTYLKELHFELCEIKLDVTHEKKILEAIEANCALCKIDLTDIADVSEEFIK